MTRKALGRGLEALLAEATETVLPTEADRKTPAPSQPPGGDYLAELPVEDIEPNPDQPRSQMDPSALEELARSIAAQGLLQPLLVSRNPGGGYTLIAGERRWLAAKQAGLDKVPALIKEVAPAARLALALIENVQRQDLNVLEEASAYARLTKDFGLSQEEVAQAVGRDRTTVTNFIRLLKLPEPVQGDLVEGRLTMGQARALLGLLESPPKLLAARAKVLSRRLTVRQTEKLVERLKKPARPRPPKPAAVQLQAEEEELRQSLGTKVSITKRGHKGRIVIEFYSADELDRLLDHLKGQ
ncbi:MAG: ParB/RepB/Spo0J family partition protein [Deltaproteobacteria bacterium]|nr:ParB/RepB/Spo0J family partition protein [Deltaproteobacteria bacterium]